MTNLLDTQIGKRVATFRKAAGLTQDALAEAIGVAPETISRLERGKSLPAVRTLAKLAGVVGVDLRDLFAPPGGDSEKERALAELVVVLRRVDADKIALVRDLVSLALQRLVPGARRVGDQGHE